MAKDETLWIDYETAGVSRSSFGLIAKGVKDVYVKAPGDILFTQYKKPKLVRQVDFLRRKKKGKDLYYDTYKITDKVVKLYPIDSSDICYQDKKGRIRYTGTFPCDLFFSHSSGKECKKNREKHIRDKVVLTDVKRCWSDYQMFSYVKENTLYITGFAVSSLRESKRVQCYERVSAAKGFFIGKGNQVKQVVSSSTDNGYIILVLMKDGSVWGLGDNTRHLLTTAEDKFYEEDFVCIVKGGVKKIGCSIDDIGILKKDNTLWTWGLGYKKGKKVSYSRKPTKVASKVKDFSISNYNLVFIKKGDTAYGMGSNASYQLSNKYSKTWKEKPVLLMKKWKTCLFIRGIDISFDKAKRFVLVGRTRYTVGILVVEKLNSVSMVTKFPL